MKPVYVRNCWYVAAWHHEIDSQNLLTCMLLNEPIVMYRRSDGTLTALEDRCPHRAAPLSMGRREGDDIRCGYHGFRFDATGACSDIPGKARIPVGVHVKSYPVAEKSSWVWIWMGAPELADLALIPDIIGLNNPAWLMRSGHVDYQANYQLVNDNLTDLSHLSYVHPQSFGVGEEWGVAQPKVESLARGIRISRWLDVKQPRAMAPGVPVPPPFQTWQSYDYLLPGVLTMVTSNYVPGAMQASDGGQPPVDLLPFFHTCTSQAVTAQSDRRTRYFYAVGVRAGEPTSEMAADLGLQMAKMAFEEDRKIIEAQQRNIDLTGNHMLLAGHDIASIQMRKIIDEFSRVEMR